MPRSHVLILILLLPAIAGAQPASGAAQPVVTPPDLGYFFDAPAGKIRPISGVPGAALLEDAPAGTVVFDEAVVAANGKYAIAVSGGQPMVVRWDGTAALLEGARGQVAFSPSGRTALVLAQGRARIWINLPESPELLREAWIEGDVTALAVSDDGAAIAWATTGGTLSYSAGDVAQAAAASGDWTSIAFLRSSADFAAADRALDQVLLVRNGQASVVAGPGRGIAEPVAVSFSLDNRRLIAANARAGSISSIDLETGEVAEVGCGCRPDGLFRLRGNAVFRLVDSLKSPLVMFDGDSDSPRVVAIGGGEQ